MSIKLNPERITAVQVGKKLLQVDFHDDDGIIGTCFVTDAKSGFQVCGLIDGKPTDLPDKYRSVLIAACAFAQHHNSIV